MSNAEEPPIITQTMLHRCRTACPTQINTVGRYPDSDVAPTQAPSCRRRLTRPTERARQTDEMSRLAAPARRYHSETQMNKSDHYDDFHASDEVEQSALSISIRRWPQILNSDWPTHTGVELWLVQRWHPILCQNVSSALKVSKHPVAMATD